MYASNNSTVFSQERRPVDLRFDIQENFSIVCSVGTFTRVDEGDCNVSNHILDFKYILTIVFIGCCISVPNMPQFHIKSN